MNDRGLKVLEQYELETVSVRRGRGSYICETDKGLKLLCDFRGSEKKMEFQNRILHRLREAGYGTVDTALENKEGKLVSLDRDENRYVVKDWFSGRECSSFGRREILEAVENLARLHCLMVFPEEEKTYCGRPLKQELEGRTRELKKIRSFIREENPNIPLSRCFWTASPHFTARPGKRPLWQKSRAGRRNWPGRSRPAASATEIIPTIMCCFWRRESPLPISADADLIIR